MLPGKVCGDVIQCEGEMWKIEERKTEMTAPRALSSLDEPTLTELRRRSDDTSDAQTRTRSQMLLLEASGQTSTQIARLVLRSQDTVVRVLTRFLAAGLDAVPRRTAPGRVRRVTAARARGVGTRDRVGPPGGWRGDSELDHGEASL